MSGHRRFKKRCGTSSPILSVCPDPTLRVDAQPDRTAKVRDPYAGGVGRGGAARRPPIPIYDPKPTF
jgi:hypothetical protein